MTTDRIPPSSSLLETFRAMARDRAGAAGAGARPSSVAGNSTPHSSRPHAVKSIGELRQRLHGLLAPMKAVDAQSLAEMRGPVLREILLWEFGADFRQDAQFLPMVDAVGNALDVDPAFGQRFAELVAQLRR